MLTQCNTEKTPRQQTDKSPLLLTEQETGDLIGFSVRTLQKWRQVGGGPNFIKISARAIRYRRSDIDAWIESRVRRSSSEADHASW